MKAEVMMPPVRKAIRLPGQRGWHSGSAQGRERQLGLTLVELMVALVLGLVLVGGVLNVLVANRQTYRSTENLIRIQENARTAFDFMARDIREAGQNPCGTPLVANLIRKSGAIPWWADWNKGTVIGVAGTVDRTDIKAFGPSTNPNARAAGTDALIVIRAEQEAERFITDHDETSFEMTLGSVKGYEADEVVIACDFKSAAIFQIGTVSPSLRSISYDEGFASLNCGNELAYRNSGACPAASKTFLPGSLVSKLSTSFWYVGYAKNGQRSLYRTRIITKLIAGVRTIITEPEEMVPGVHDLQITYLTSNGVTLASDWVDASNTVFDPINNAWAPDNVKQAVAVRLELTLQSEDGIGIDQQPIQRKLIHVVALRNREHLF